tara:strand:- start:322 stop:444 length:123 start_codon:yes stop_codon:yes gene_type:complete
MSKLYKAILWLIRKTYEMDALAYRGREWDWMSDKHRDKNE